MSPLSALDAWLAGVARSRDVVTLLGSVAFGALLALSAFFSSAEIALFSLARHRVEALADTDTPGAAALATLVDRPHDLLTTILVGNNLVNVAMSSLATTLLSYYLSQGQAVVAATVGVTTVVLLFGESAPKSYAVENTESWALRTARPLLLARRLTYPLVVIFARLTRLVNRVIGDGLAVEDERVSRDDLRELAQTGLREGTISSLEHTLIRRAFRLSDGIAREVMTPRPDVVAVPADTTVDTAIERCLENGHDRLPVYDETLDDVRGVVSLTALVAHRQQDVADETPVCALANNVRYVPETTPVDDVLDTLQRDATSVALVVDEFGGTAGLVTLSDVTDLVVGCESDGDRTTVTVVNDTTVYAHGSTPLDDVNGELGFDFPESGEYETIAGFILDYAGRLVDAGEEFTYGDTTIRVEAVERKRIQRVRIERTTTAESTRGTSAAAS
ncbi:hemolysin family protein [Halarchaeum sp. P4]|uniref:hemolysin family protein n=1 Tax=Halarchaeum sp. P4 TaxID=3421639 RepID=UPI003EBC9BC8